MKLYSTTSKVPVSRLQEASQHQQASALQSPMFNGIKAPARLSHDQVTFSGTKKYYDLATREIISTPHDDLQVRDSALIGGLNSGHKIYASEVNVTGDVIAQGDITYTGSEAQGLLKSWFGSIDTDHAEHLGGLHAPMGNIKANEVAVHGGKVVADQGNVEFFGSEIYGDGEIRAGGNVNVTKSAHINAIQAGGDIDTYEITAKKDVVSERGNIDFMHYSDALGKLQTLAGKIHVKDGDVINSIDSASTVHIEGINELRGAIEAGDNVTLRTGSDRKKKMEVNDVIVHSGKSEEPNTVDIGPGVTVKGNIMFDNGNGTVLLREGAKFDGKTNGEIQSDKKNKENEKSSLFGIFGRKNGSSSSSSNSTQFYPSGVHGSSVTLTSPPNYPPSMYQQDNGSGATIRGTGHPLRHRTSTGTIATIATLPVYGDESKSTRLNPDTGKPEDDQDQR